MSRLRARAPGAWTVSGSRSVSTWTSCGTGTPRASHSAARGSSAVHSLAERDIRDWRRRQVHCTCIEGCIAISTSRLEASGIISVRRPQVTQHAVTLGYRYVVDRRFGLF
ncbi:hypothetical protein GCM10010359_09820 [Streptomyces morookaense]|nr:hypothetical protein GCM10010359_09820 [Streptomyces morookaense]